MDCIIHKFGFSFYKTINVNTITLDCDYCDYCEHVLGGDELKCDVVCLNNFYYKADTQQLRRAKLDDIFSI